MHTKRYVVLLGAVSTLLVISFAVNIHLINQNSALKTTRQMAEDVPPDIVAIEFLDVSGKDVMKEGWATVPPDGQLRIRLNLKGVCTSVDLFITPTGTETYLLQSLVARLDVTAGQEEIDYIWDVPTGTMGHFSIIAYNGMKGTKSGTYNIYAE